MLEIEELKAENKQLRKQLKGENLRLYRDIEIYISYYEIKREELVNIENQMLIDFIQISNEGKNVWDTIGSPHEYCDKYLVNYEKRETSILLLLRKYIPLVLFFLSAYILMDNYFSVYQQNYIDPSLVQITSANLMKNISFSILYLFLVLDDKNKLFVRNKSLRIGSFKFLILWFIIYAVGINLMNDLFVFTIPKIYLYIVLLISLSLIFYNRRISKNA